MRRIAVLVALAGCGSDEAPGDAGEARTGTFRSGDIDLSYALDLPPGDGPFPGAVLVHGSGRTRKEELVPLSRNLVQRGLAVIRFDKRGAGGSGGVYSGVGVMNSPEMIPLLAGDVAAAVDFLAGRPELDGERLGLVGASQAGWIIPVAAQLSPGVRFAVVLVGPTVSVGREIYFSSLVEATDLPLSEAELQLEGFDGPEGFDPRPYLEELQASSLWLYGLVDRSIPTQACLAVHESIPAGAARELVVYPELGHGLGPSIWSDVNPWLDATLD
ncbi:MAG TPA: alpha/beta hydrolase [Kofleriaceae bacterium]|nr:alpha/beta hydrolase [Kofleriaceae bacterium]